MENSHGFFRISLVDTVIGKNTSPYPVDCHTSEADLIGQFGQQRRGASSEARASRIIIWFIYGYGLMIPLNFRGLSRT